MDCVFSSELLNSKPRFTFEVELSNMDKLSGLAVSFGGKVRSVVIGSHSTNFWMTLHADPEIS